MKKKKIKLCLTKQLLNMFKLWCEWGITYSVNVPPGETLMPVNTPDGKSCNWFLDKSLE